MAKEVDLRVKMEVVETFIEAAERFRSARATIMTYGTKFGMTPEAADLLFGYERRSKEAGEDDDWDKFCVMIGKTLG